MPTTHDTPRLEALLAHSDWVRGLVAGLVLDPARADDAVQETWLAALERPPKHDGDLRAWLATVARNAVRRIGRGESRRTRREHVAARLEALPDTVDVIAKARMQRRLVDAALALDEPYRSTVLLRYFEDLPPREIAARLGRPVNTVRTHLERGLAKLRRELDAEYGDREAWAFAFLPLCFDRTALAASGSLLLKTGGILMLCKYVLPAAALVFGLAAWIGSEGERDAEEVAALDRTADAGPAVVRRDDPRAASAPDDDADRVPALADAAPPEVVAPAATHRYAGVLLDVEGRPVPRAELVVTDPAAPRRTARGIALGGRLVALTDDEIADLLARPESLRERVPDVRDEARFLRLLAGEAVHEERVTTDDAGRFDVALAFPDGAIETRAVGRLLLGKGRVDGEVMDVYLMVRTREVAGRVVDQDGEPLDAVSLAVPMTVERTPGLPFVLRDADSFRSSWSTQTGPDGRFRIGSVPAVAGLRLTCERERHERRSVVLTDADQPALEVVMQRADASRYVAGRVLRADGGVATHVEVSLGFRRALTDERGAFRFRLDAHEIPPVLVAHEPHVAPAIVDDLESRLEEDPDGCQELELRLGEPTGAVEGRVVDDAGRGMGGVAVHVVDGASTGDGRVLEMLLAQQRTDFVTTTADGGFAVEGLFRPTCDLLFHDLSTGRVKTVDGVERGARGLRVVLGSDLSIPELRGRVVDRRGVAVVGATLATRFTVRDGGATGATYTGGRLLGETDEDGAFALRDVPFGDALFLVHGEGIEESTFALSGDESGELRLEVPLRVRYRVDGDAAPGARRYEMRDAGGQPLQVHEIYPDHTGIWTRAPIRRGEHRPTVETSDAAIEIVFLSGDDVVERKALHPRRGDVVEIR